MKLSEINESVSLLANIGVLASIVFLALEISQNSEITQSQTRATITQNTMLVQSTAANPDVADIMFQGFNGELTGPSSGRIVFLNIVSMTLRTWENEWYQYQRNLYSDDEFLPRLNNWKSRLANPGFRAIWELEKDSYSGAFQNQIEELISEFEEQ